MPLDDTYAHSVVLILGERTRDGLTRREPIGTGFFVSMPCASVQDGYFMYVVTAAHVVATESWTGIRFTRADGGGVVDFDVPRWHQHATEDVAAAPVSSPRGLRVTHVPEEGFYDKWDQKAKLGDRVYFIGLLSGIAAMADANVPMVRTGTLGCLYQPKVPVELPDGTILRLTGHLIDCRSYGGFSGSPCFVQSQVSRFVDMSQTIPGGMRGHALSDETILLGVVVGHFDQWAKAKTTGDIIGSIEAPVATGVGVVVPVEAIRQLLDEDDDLVARRRDAEARRASQSEPTS